MADVFPTCVGMNLTGQYGITGIRGIPHVRGDEPRVQFIHADALEYSPRVWG